jgi:DNA-binding Xre family transcriptional regulator
MRKTNQILWELYIQEDCSRTDFCKKLGMKGYSNMSCWLNDKHELSIDQLNKICKKLGKELIIKIKE